MKSLDENFWETAFSLRCPSPDHSSGVASPGKENVRVTSPGKENVTATFPAKERPNTQADKEQGRRGSYWAPRFLLPVMREVVSAGKSMELLQTLGRLGKVLREHDNEGTCRWQMFCPD